MKGKRTNAPLKTHTSPMSKQLKRGCREAGVVGYKGPAARTGPGAKPHAFGPTEKPVPMAPVRGHGPGVTNRAVKP
jgi:hypothetical protein